jgi:hypothetical protein
VTRCLTAVALAACLAGLLIACGSTSVTGARVPPSSTAVTSLPPAPTTVACQTGSARLAVGVELRILGCPAGTVADPQGEAIVAAGAFVVRAVRSGSADLQLLQRPICATGTACPQFRVLRGRITVTVN